MIIVIGSGISGLAAAYELFRRGVAFKVLESSSRPGGLIRTEQHGGFTIDAGADSMLATKPSARALCAELGLTASLQSMNEPRSAFVLARNRLFELPVPSVLGLPLTAGAALRFELLPLHARMRVLLEPFVARGSGGDESVASFFTRRFGASTVELVAQPLLGGIHAGDTSALSTRMLFPNLLDAEAAGSVLRSLARRPPPAGGMFASLSGGMETLPVAASRALPPQSVKYDAEVRRVTRTEDGWRVDTAAASEHADGILFAAPMHVTARLFQTIDSPASAFFSAIPHASSVSVALAWPRDAIAHPLRGSGFVVARQTSGPSEPRITACTWVSSKWTGRAPHRHAILRAFIGGVRDPQAIDLADDDLIEIARRDLGRVLGIAAAPDLARVYRWRDASPQLTVGHDERVNRIAGRIRELPGIFVTGRGFRAVGIPDCISDARSAASAAAEYAARANIRT